MAFVFRPLRDAQVTSPFGDSPNRRDHKGVDYRAPVGTPLYAMGNGIVERADNVDDSDNGKNVVIIDDSDGRLVYLHMSDVAVVGGQRVAAGQRIGRSGETGATRGPHLHLQWQPRYPSSSSVADIDPVVQNLADPPEDDDDSIVVVVGALFVFVGGMWWLSRKRKRAA